MQISPQYSCFINILLQAGLKKKAKHIVNNKRE
ncbi:hypothetical protein EABG_02931 [Escherichia coli H223]|nr:hypothetical protein EABG_02931 [Escherichia coli H223]